MTRKIHLGSTHIILYIIICLISSLLVFAKNCEELQFEGELICRNPEINGGGAARRCQGPQPPGTLVSYKCKSHFVLHRSLERIVWDGAGVRTEISNERSLKCNENGTWSGHKLFLNTRCREVCGLRTRTNPKPLVVNGVATNETTWPWHATLFRRRGEGLEYICGGTIIQRSAILTAAHCTTNTLGEPKGTSIVVVVGASTSDFTKIKEQSSSHAQIFEVKHNFVSENFDERKDFQADIAVLELDGMIEYNDYVSSVCLPDFLLDFNAVKEGRIGDIVGFGIDESEKISPILKHGRLEIASHTECFIKLQRTISQSQFCAGTVNKGNWVSACNGDSGGGLFMPSVIDEKYYIHGIVSNGELSPRRIIKCQNYAVFTRVHSFNAWLKNVLEKVSSDKEVLPGNDVGIEVIQNGTETNRMGFQPIPLEFKNKVTSVHLGFLDIDPESLLNSLEHTKTVKELNFTNVRFTKPFPNRRVVRLPNLKTVTLDILTAQENLNFIEFLKFWEKDVKDLSDTSDISDVTESQVNVYITIGIFKLIQVNHDSGEISLSQIKFSNQILNNILGQNFHLNRLALSSCPFNMSILTEETNRMGLAELKSLILDRVMLEGDFNSNSLYNLLKNSRKLEELIISDTRRTNLAEFSMTLHLATMPTTLRHLSLTRTPLYLGTYDDIAYSEFPGKGSQRNPSPSSIFFQDYSSFSSPSKGHNRNRRVTPSSVTFPNLETFYCDLCLPSLDSIKELNTIFPNLKKLIVKFQGNRFREENLKSLVSMFGVLQSVVFLPSIDGVLGVKLVRESPRHQWVYVRPKLKNWDWEKIQLNYDLSRKSQFWTSEADYVCSTRLSTLERSAFETGHYKFDGAVRGGVGRFSPILQKIQMRLESIEISNTDMSTKDLMASLRSCSNLKSLRLLNVSSLDLLSGETVDLPQLLEYRSERGFVSIWEKLAYNDLVVIMETYLPFQFVISEQNETPDFDVSTTLLKSRVPKFHIQFGKCVVVSWDSTTGSLTSFSSYVNDWLRNGPRDSAASATYLNTLALQFTQLDPSAVPSSVSSLNLNFVILNDPSALLKKLTALNTFRFVNVRTSGENERSSGNTDSWEWPNLDLSHLARHPLQIIAIEKAHLQNYVSGVQFPHVTVLCLISCSFETNFVKDFRNIFPNLKKLVILTGIAGSADTAGIILEGLKNHPNLEWILTNSQSLNWKKNNDRGSGDELRSILQSAGAGVNLTTRRGEYFIVNRRRKIASAWTWQNNISHEQIKSKLLLRIKGTTEFGADQKCHGYDLYKD